MASTRARYPHLVRLGTPPTIVGHRCTNCERVFFPPDPYGCERCGATADALVETELAATGTVRALATVHRHHHPRPATPFTVATIGLDDGPVLKAVLTDSEAVSIGSRVRGVTIPWETDDDGVDVVDLRFTQEEG